ncbi:hypothetical protein HJC23_006638 [Cyclotella cryptica]|uniref:K-box domain-containing protein n=1 Tax=Cyclotella cryptica TaxID=29204 RepID=A0ABD3R0K1_9STRA|eukprot:CCRYP_001062-RA/>CCRYP_001062-RA protein AED:0.28 eAED:0.28 QI:0/-1/0/1/-1/1/1/0/190
MINQSNRQFLNQSEQGILPHRYSMGLLKRDQFDRSMESSTTKSVSSRPLKHVSFSEYSTVCVYRIDPNYELKKSYSSAERRAFKNQAARDSGRIQKIIASCPLQDSQTLNRLLDLNIINLEDLLGIEHLMSEKSFTRLIKQRRAHVGLLLRKQEELRKMNIKDENILAADALTRSAESLARARCRAALAA